MSGNNGNMKAMVLQVLNRNEIVNKINFKIGLAYVNPRYYQRMKDAISDGKIRVVHASGMSSSGKYDDGLNKLKLKFNTLSNNSSKKVAREALIFHECTHAALDIRGLPRMILHAEACGYLAQWLYTYYRMPGEFDSGSVTPPSNGIHGAAWEVAKMLIDKRANGAMQVAVTDYESKSLFNAIRSSGLYPNYESNTKYNGV